MFVVSKELADKLLKGAATYKSRTIVPYLSLDLASLDIHAKDDDVRIERTGELTFKIARLGLARVARGARQAVVRVRGDARGELHDAPTSPTPAVTITMTPKDGRPRGELLVGGACPDHPDDVVVVRTDADTARSVRAEGDPRRARR